MDTKKNRRTRVYVGDACNVDPANKHEQKRIEDHPQHLIEDHPQHLLENIVEDEAIAAIPPVERKSTGVLGWCLAALLAIVLIGGCLYFTTKKDSTDTYKAKQTAFVSTPGKTGNTTGQTDGYSQAANDGYNVSGTKGYGISDEFIENYVYYFGNDKSAVTDNSVLDNLALKAEKNNADIEITAYASMVGNSDYNQRLSEKRAANVASYLVAHGVPKDHIKVISNGQTQSFGDNAHNRRADIHVVYPG